MPGLHCFFQVIQKKRKITQDIIELLARTGSCVHSRKKKVEEGCMEYYYRNSHFPVWDFNQNIIHFNLDLLTFSVSLIILSNLSVATTSTRESDITLPLSS